MNLLITQNSQNLSHDHNFTPSGNISSNNSTEDNKTSGMSGNATGHVQLYSGNGAAITSGNFSTQSVSTNQSPMIDVVPNGSQGKTQLKLNVAHTHSAYFKGSNGTTGKTGNTESRPIDFTYKVWKRTA